MLRSFPLHAGTEKNVSVFSKHAPNLSPTDIRPQKYSLKIELSQQQRQSFVMNTNHIVPIDHH